jgi:predicted P-loop ATPase
MPYGQTMEGRRRYASFIATTNNQQPLIDDTGSRRFVCIKVEKNIDTGTPINYPQLYAQLLHELNEGYRYWFNEEETSRIMKDNTLFQRTEGLDEILLSLFRRPRENEEMTPLNISDIITTIKCNMPNFQANDTMAARIGCALNRLDIQKSRKKNGTYYNLLVRSTTKKPAI